MWKKLLKLGWYQVSYSRLRLTRNLFRLKSLATEEHLSRLTNAVLEALTSNFIFALGLPKGDSHSGSLVEPYLQFSKMLLIM
jgi:hypothetical protein